MRRGAFLLTHQSRLRPTPGCSPSPLPHPLTTLPVQWAVVTTPVHPTTPIMHIHTHNHRHSNRLMLVPLPAIRWTTTTQPVQHQPTTRSTHICNRRHSNQLHSSHLMSVIQSMGKQPILATQSMNNRHDKMGRMQAVLLHNTFGSCRLDVQKDKY